MTIRRLKTYSGSQGYVYQYYFVGKRMISGTEDLSAEGDEYVFDVTSDRKSTFPVKIFLPHDVVVQWASTRPRSLSDAEKYAAVKMRLFRAFDESEDLQNAGDLIVDGEFLESSLAGLGVE